VTALPVLLVTGATFVVSLSGLLADAIWRAPLAVAALPLLLVVTTVALLLAFALSPDGDASGRSTWANHPDSHWLVVVAVLMSLVAAAAIAAGLVRDQRGWHGAGCLIALIAAIVLAITTVVLAA
jgi:cellobiose-specific phosphotransferase system component IIC